MTTPKSIFIKSIAIVESALIILKPRLERDAPGEGEVAKQDIVKGYEIEPGKYVLLEDEEIDAVKLETRHTMN